MKKKIVSVCLVVCLLATAIIGTTLAYFTDEKAVTNTFTTGDVTIKLDETDVGTNGVATGEGRKEEGNEYHLLPGKTYTKDPMVTVKAGSEECYLFVRVENGLGKEVEGVWVSVEAEDNTIADQMAAKGWTPVDGETNVYMQEGTYTDDALNNTAVVFEKFKIDEEATAEDLTGIGQVVITAYAVQAEGFLTAQAAWDATFGA